MQHRLEYLAVLIIRQVVLLMPLKSAQRMGRLLGSIAYHLLGSRRRVALDNLQHAFPEKSISELLVIAKGAFRNYGISLVELLWFPNFTDDSLSSFVSVKNLDVLERASSQGKGMVLLSGHFGNWEMIVFAIAWKARMPVSIIVQTQNNKLVDGLINRHRCLRGNRTIPMGMSIREILRTIQQGGVIGIAPDQSGPMEGVFVNFFGRLVATHQGPAAFALRTAAPMCMGFTVRKEDGTYEAIVEEIRMDDLSGSEEEKVIEVTQRHTALLERYIRMHPDHWLWMHRRWKHTWESVQGENRRMSNTHD